MNELDQPLEGPLVTEACQPANLRQLSAAIIRQALRDMKSWKKPRRSLDAIVWLTDPRSDFSLHIETANMGHLDVFEMLVSGKARIA